MTSESPQIQAEQVELQEALFTSSVVRDRIAGSIATYVMLTFNPDVVSGSYKLYPTSSDGKVVGDNYVASGSFVEKYESCHILSFPVQKKCLYFLVLSLQLKSQEPETVVTRLLDPFKRQLSLREEVAPQGGASTGTVPVPDPVSKPKRVKREAKSVPTPE